MKSFLISYNKFFNCFEFETLRLISDEFIEIFITNYFNILLYESIRKYYFK